MFFSRRPQRPALIRPAVTSLALVTLFSCANYQPSEQAIDPLPDVEVEQNLHFGQDSLYRLMTAELALVREYYDIGLDNYVEEAISSRDVAVTARATQVARILKKHDETLVLAEQWRELDPGSYEARFILISEYIYAERFEQAFAEAQRLLAAGHSAGFEDIAIDAAQKNYTGRSELSTAYAELRKQYPRVPELLVGHSILLQSLGELEPALTAIQKANKIDDSNPRALFQEFRVLSALQRNDEALDAYGRMVELQPENIQLRNRYAQLLIGSDLNLAMKQYEILHRQDKQDADILLNLALLQFDQGELDEAERNFLTLISRKQHQSTANYNLGLLAAQRGNARQALSYFIAVKDGPRYVDASSRAADLIASNEGFSSAQAFISGRREQASSPEAQESLYQIEAETLASAGQKAQAASLYKVALEQFPGSVRLHYSRAMYYTEIREPEKAEQDFLVVLSQAPNSAATLNALGYTLLDQTDRLADATLYIERAYELDSEDAAIVDSMGWLRFKQQQYDEALKLLRRAYEIFPDHEIAAHLGEVLWQQGRQRAARKIWREGLELRPQSPVILTTLQRLGVEL
ncbi:tetratricopeptide repeat protein [Agaribacterium haliotis]|uniref:tetratricopeptide repeat protein n=1 Tax=Agaribacterium haliotis TaxID=2013869 RepID=UPI000BB5521D|nr:tetratricopeptide repeat protein [Agaribacterium haliotis]